jgi:hypothetical protein
LYVEFGSGRLDGKASRSGGEAERSQGTRCELREPVL